MVTELPPVQEFGGTAVGETFRGAVYKRNKKRAATETFHAEIAVVTQCLDR